MYSKLDVLVFWICKHICMFLSFLEFFGVYISANFWYHISAKVVFNFFLAKVNVFCLFWFLRYTVQWWYDSLWWVERSQHPSFFLRSLQHHKCGFFLLMFWTYFQTNGIFFYTALAKKKLILEKCWIFWSGFFCICDTLVVLIH